MFDTEAMIRYGGLLILFLAVFAQTGLFFCFFIPSGGLLFTAGVFIAAGDLSVNIILACALLTLASFFGNLTGYWIGRKTGPLLYERKESRFFKKKHLAAAESFFQKHGDIALAAGLFFPIIRSFAPLVSGMIRHNLRRFMIFTLTGSALWITSFVLSGYLLGTMPFLEPYLKYIVIGVILFVTTPVVITIFRSIRKRSEG